MSVQKDKEIEDFWNWFSRNCQKFGENFENKDLLEKLDDWISKLGEFSWEVGPGKKEANALVISPNGDDRLIVTTRKIIEKAIACKGWEYYYAKPPKDWDLKFYYQTNDGQSAYVDASQWEYVLLRNINKRLDIVIKSTKFYEIDENDRQLVIEILLDGIIGEELRMKLFDSLELVPEFALEEMQGANNISVLSNHLNSIVGRSK